jgi:thiamine pyrophosphate-dependent acetolactate synthase large subunit-like protein
MKSPEYGSDVIVDLLSALGVEYVAVNPGATFRGIHDSIVNHAGNVNPELILTTHEEIAVAIAHGYAKASGRPMVAIVHNIVGLLHASNAIHGTMLDQIPVIVMGGTGPMAQEKRRPWIDWIHTALVQGNAVRDFVKWDDQPASIPSAIDSILRGFQIATTEPRGPVYICIDAELQEMHVDAGPADVPALERYAAPSRVQADPEALARAAALLVGAENPVVFADRVGRDEEAFQALQELAELLALPVISPVAGAVAGRRAIISFPSTHPLDLTGCESELLSKADVVLSLEVFDPSPLVTSFDHHGGARTGRLANLALPEGCQYIDISMRHFRWRSWTQDYGMLLPTDVPMTADVGLAVPALLNACRELLATRDDVGERIRVRYQKLADQHTRTRQAWSDEADRASEESPIAPAFLARELGEVIKDDDWVLANGSLDGWTRRLWDWDKPYRFVGAPGLGYGVGVSIGAALANKSHGRLTVDIQADGDLLFTPGGLWTAAHHKVPMLVVMYNNRSYYNDEKHQERVAITRGRPVENRVTGIRLEEPVVDFAGLARSFGVAAEGPIDQPAEVRPALERAANHVRTTGLPALVDVICQRRR